MPERATVNEWSRWGFEATHGVYKTQDFRQLQATTVRLNPQIEIERFAPQGYKYPVHVFPAKEMVTGEIEGKGSYSDMSYLVSGILKPATIIRNIPTTGLSYTWTWTQGGVGEDDPVSFTIEAGQVARVERAAYAIINQLGLAFNRSTVETSGELMARPLDDGIGFSGTGFQELAAVPILGSHVNVYLDATSAALGTTKMVRMVSADWSLGDRFLPMFYLDRSQPSFTNHVETSPTGEIKLVMQADATAMGLLNNMRSGASMFMRIEALGPLIETIYYHSFIIDACVKVVSAPSRSDQDGIYGAEWTFAMVHDTTWAKAFEIKANNRLATL